MTAHPGPQPVLLIALSIAICTVLAIVAFKERFAVREGVMERRATQVLKLLERAPGGLTATQVAHRLNLNHSATSAYLGKMVMYGNIERQRGDGMSSYVYRLKREVLEHA